MTTLDETRRILADLVAFPTISSDGNLELVAYVSDLLSSLGASISLSLDATGTKANLFATIGEEKDGGIILSGHTDVVPVEGQDWTSDPFSLVEENGRLYGRGTCDMKGFLAICLALAPRFAEVDLKRPLHLAFTYDEEVGCLGGRELVRELQKSSFKPAVAIIGEPSSMRVIEGHKGCFEYTTVFTGHEGHASRPDLGVNAIDYASRFTRRLLELGAALKGQAPEGSRYEPPWSTVQVGRIQGGMARNVIAGHCQLEWEVRTVRPGDADHVWSRMHALVEDELLPEMRRDFPEADIVTHVIGEVEGLEVVPHSPAFQLVSELTGANDADVVAFGTEAGLFQSCGISAVICGPGSIEQAHKPDEYVEITQIEAGIAMMERLLERMSRP